MAEPANSTGHFQSRLHRQSRPGTFAIVLSIFVHAAALGGAAYTHKAGASEFDDFKVYRVKVYSPPPQVEGPPQPVPPVIEPAPPAPEPNAKAVEAPKPKPEPPKPQPKPEPKPAAKPPTPAPTPAKKPEPTKTAESSKSGSASRAPNKPVVGPNARADSPGGENIDVDIDGAEFPFPGYLENVILQINRYFRWTGACNLTARIGFYIRDDGSVQSPRVIQGSGNREFDRAALRAIEMVGTNKQFGALPEQFTLDRLGISYTFDPPCAGR